MSDERRPTADGERGGRRPGPSGESPVERLLREAMAARAARITTQDLRPAAPPQGPRAGRRPAYLVGLPLMGLAAAMIIGVLTVPTDTLADKGDGAPAATLSGSPGESRGPDPLSPTAQPSDLLGVPAGAPAAGAPSQGQDAASEGAVPGGTRAPGRGSGGGTRPGTGPADQQPGGTSGGPAPAAPPPADGTGAVRPAQGIDVTVDGLAGAEAIVGGNPVVFSVTWHNTTQQAYGTVAPVVAVRALADPVGTDRSVRGALQREDGGGVWTDVQLTEASGAFLASGDAVAFPLAAGATRTIRYRLSPAINSGAGTLLLEALALLPSVPQRIVEASTLAALRLSKAPADAQKAPVLTTATPTTGSLTMTVHNPGAAPLASVLPTIRLNGREAARIVVQARYGSGAEGMRTLPVAPAGDGQAVVDTSLLERLVRPNESTTFTFVLSVPEDWRADGPGDYSVLVGARGDGREAAPAVVSPGFHRLVTAPVTP
ncbi:hypothetical protein ABTX81_05390 [Kitasatospora sp. NPDC097605]|uniref:hypothetical protein n=1 Tax=Kitasatospora sp. NPDC097605 TaxID=3157226 RepID=UPI00331C6B21